MKSFKSIAIIIIALAALVGLSFLNVAAYTLEESFQKTIPQEGAVKLTVSNRNGDIEITPWQEAKISIEAIKKVEAVDEKKAKEYAEQLKIEISREGREIVIRTIWPESEGNRGFWNMLRRKTSEISFQPKVNYKILVPEKFDLESWSRNGTIKTGGLQGDVTGETRNGNIQVDNIKGKVVARSRNGDIQLSAVDGLVEAETRNGNITLSRIARPVKTVTRNGNILIDQVDGDVSAQSRNGTISLLKVGGSVNASTKNGPIRAEITGKNLGDCAFSSRNASISLVVPGSLSADFDLFTRHGKVATKLPVVVSESLRRGELKGRINQGGPRLRLWTENGNISIEKSEEVTQ